MIEIIGKYNSAICYTDYLDSAAYTQILTVCNSEEFASSKIRIMPDVHAGKGCTIGTSMTISDKIVPNMVGVDIGCGMETVCIAESSVDFDRLDHVIRSRVPSGRKIRETAHPLNAEIDLNQLRCADAIKLDYARRSIGTLGGGNHFIELDYDEDANLYLVVHSGSRHLGCEVAKYYQEQGFRALWGASRYQIGEKIEALKECGRTKEIENILKELRKANPVRVPREFAYVEGPLFDDYIHDMKIVQQFAALNRRAITDEIIGGMHLTETDRFTTIHNYIDTDAMILRKGSVSAKSGEKLLIPINMRDGSLLCVGKGNEEWNCSAPHGAGRLLSRSDANRELSMEEYRKAMAGIYSTCVTPDTLDESPMAYKSIDEILYQIEPTADVLRQILPIYNFKASDLQ